MAPPSPKETKKDVPDEPSFTECFRKAAADSGCELEEAFDQTTDVINPWQNKPDDLKRRGHGICYGLCCVWINLLADGEGDAKIFRARVTGQDKKVDLRDTAYKWYGYQAKEFNKPQTLWLPESDLADTEKSRANFFIERESDKVDGHGRYPRFEDNLDKLVEWLNATTLKRRFFLIHFVGYHGKHCMAAAKNRMGRLRFYDPNGGVVGAWSSSAVRMRDFFRCYFLSKTVFDLYLDKLRRGSIVLDAEKYKPKPWF